MVLTLSFPDLLARHTDCRQLLTPFKAKSRGRSTAKTSCGTACAAALIGRQVCVLSTGSLITPSSRRPSASAGSSKRKLAIYLTAVSGKLMPSARHGGERSQKLSDHMFELLEVGLGSPNDIESTPTPPFNAIFMLISDLLCPYWRVLPD